MGAAELSFEDLTHAFGPLPVFAGLSGRVRGGEVLAVSGPNGSGKSTLLRCLAGLVRPQRGEVRLAVDGAELDEPARRRAVGYVAPELSLYGELTAGENLAFFSRLRGLPVDGDALLERFGVPPGRSAAVLSSGMTQRLRWAWALLHRPSVLLLDEPFQNVDPEGRQALAAALGEHLDDGGAAVVADPQPFDHPHVATRLALDG